MQADGTPRPVAMPAHDGWAIVIANSRGVAWQWVFVAVAFVALAGPGALAAGRAGEPAGVAVALLIALGPSLVMLWLSRQLTRVAVDSPTAKYICLEDRWKSIVLPATEIVSVAVSHGRTQTLSTVGMLLAPTWTHSLGRATFYVRSGRRYVLPLDGPDSITPVILSLQAGNPAVTVFRD